MTTLSPAIWFATSASLPELDADERPMIDALARRGLIARPAVWSDPALDWSEPAMVLVRCTWDYHERQPEFLAWAQRVGRATRLLNPVRVIAWNSDKVYLRDLERRGIPVVPTHWVEPGGCDLAELLARRGWGEAVLKPTISAAALNTIRFDRARLPEAQALLERLRPEKRLMVQPYLESVETYGERSLVFVAGALSHAVRRNPALAGGTVDHFNVFEVPASAEEVALAERILAAMPEAPFYARVDLVRGPDGAPMLLELEVIEPSLFLGFSTGAYARFTEAIVRRLALPSLGREVPTR